MSIKNIQLSNFDTILKYWKTQINHLNMSYGEGVGWYWLGGFKYISPPPPPSKFSLQATLSPNTIFEENFDFFGRKWNLYVLSQEPWNPSGTNLLNENWPFPIFMVDNEETVNFLQKCFNDFNKPDPDTNASRDWPLCAIELQVIITDISFQRSTTIINKEYLIRLFQVN